MTGGRIAFKFLLVNLQVIDMDTKKLEQKYLKYYEIWCWRRMEKIKWSENVNVTNETFLEHAGQKRTLLSNILR